MLVLNGAAPKSGLLLLSVWVFEGGGEGEGGRCYYD